MLTGALVLILAILGRRLWCNGHYHGLTEGMLAGYGEGDRDGFNRGYSRAQLDSVLAAPSLGTHADRIFRIIGADATPVQDEDIRRLVDGCAMASVALHLADLHEHVGEETS